MKFSCPQCGGEIEANEAWGGRKVTCPHCAKNITLPACGGGTVVPRSAVPVAPKPKTPNPPWTTVPSTDPPEPTTPPEPRKRGSSKSKKGRNWIEITVCGVAVAAVAALLICVFAVWQRSKSHAAKKDVTAKSQGYQDADKGHSKPEQPSTGKDTPVAAVSTPECIAEAEEFVKAINPSDRVLTYNTLRQSLLSPSVAHARELLAALEGVQKIDVQLDELKKLLVKPVYKEPLYKGVRTLSGIFRGTYNGDEGIVVQDGDDYYVIEGAVRPNVGNVNGFVRLTSRSTVLDLGRSGRTAKILILSNPETYQDDQKYYRETVTKAEADFTKAMKDYESASDPIIREQKVIDLNVRRAQALEDAARKVAKILGVQPPISLKPSSGTSISSSVAAVPDKKQAAAPNAPDDLSLIPAGEFTMGDALDGDKEAPQHKVSVSAFYMQKKEVTKAQWDEVRAWGLKNGYTDLPEGAGKAAGHPVHTVSWYAVVKWCNARSQKEGLTPCYTVAGAVYKTSNNDAVMCDWHAKGYRLPTEAEWEKAARGGLSGKRFPWGDVISHEQANFCNIGKESYQKGTTYFHPTYETGKIPYTSPVGSFAANGYGLYDMAGNVREWCWDWHGEYPSALQTNPRGAASGMYRVFRGGFWLGTEGSCRVADRSCFEPTGSYNDFGFRTARSSISSSVAVPDKKDNSEPAATSGISRLQQQALDKYPEAKAGRVMSLGGPRAGEMRAADLGGGMKLDLCGIPAGSFTMGGTGSDEKPHKVTLTKPFWLGRTEVTQGQWQAVMGKNPSNFRGDRNLPVATVSRDDASEFCDKLSAKGLLPAEWKFALPTEAQWEYACRAGTTGEYAGTLDAMAWYDKNSGSKTHPVGTKKPNAWGLSDMHGNVWEWCADGYENYPSSAVTDPTGPKGGSDRVLRGGSWYSVDSGCRSAIRLRFTPGYRSNGRMGFRVAAIPVGPGQGGAASALPSDTNNSHAP